MHLSFLCFFFFLISVLFKSFYKVTWRAGLYNASASFLVPKLWRLYIRTDRVEWKSQVLKWLFVMWLILLNISWKWKREWLITLSATHRVLRIYISSSSSNCCNCFPLLSASRSMIIWQLVNIFHKIDTSVIEGRYRNKTPNNMQKPESEKSPLLLIHFHALRTVSHHYKSNW